MRLIHKTSRVEIWEIQEEWGAEYYVYGVTLGGDPYVCPSIGMAYEVAAGASDA